MSDMSELEAFESNLDAHVRWVRESARAPSAWERARAHYGVPPGIAPVTGAAPAAQVRAVLQAVVLRAAHHLESLQAHADPARLDALWARLGQLVEHETKAYEQSTGGAAPAGGRLGGLFANATAHVGKEPWAGMEWSQQITVLCRACGAAQAESRESKCRYCSGDLFKRRG